MNMVSFVLMEEVNKVIPEEKQSPSGSNYMGNYDKEIILERFEVNTSKIV